MRLYRVIIVCLALLASSFLIKNSFAQNEELGYYQQTGHRVSQEFLTAYYSIPAPEKIYGYPITQAFSIPAADGVSQLQVQYFEHVRFEYDPQKPAEVQVSLSPLGVYVYDYAQSHNPGAPLAVTPGLAACREINTHQVCYAFLDFFDTNGGISQFGYPISEVEDEDGLMVQYFQRARFEWRPEKPAGERVVLSNLGEMYFQIAKEDPHYKMPASGGDILLVVTSLKIDAFVERAVIGNEDTQTLYVIVSNQNGQPAPEAAVSFDLLLANGETNTVKMPLTDSNGITQISFPTQNQSIGINFIPIQASYDKFSQKTTISYRVWW